MTRHVRHLAHDALPRILLVLPIASHLKHRRDLRRIDRDRRLAVLTPTI